LKREQEFGKNSLNTVPALISIAHIHCVQDNYLEAVETYSLALKIQDVGFGPDSQQSIKTLLHLASFHHRERNLEQALQEYHRALDIMRKTNCSLLDESCILATIVKAPLLKTLRDI
jgi:tetratricopeptide (TPR) repeat protein